MLVSADGTTEGTIGGGRFELEIQQLAQEVLTENRPRLVVVEEQGEEGLTCGGRMSVFLEPLRTGPRLVIVGSGHVGQALAKTAQSCNWQVLVADDRTISVEEPWPFVQLKDYTDPFTKMQVQSEDCIVICSRSHATDLETLRAALNTEVRFLGLLGSRKKKTAFWKTLQDEGVTTEQLSRVVTPVGLDIGAGSPAEIAVSIMAQLIQYRSSV